MERVLSYSLAIHFQLIQVDDAERSTGCDKGQRDHKPGEVRLTQRPTETECSEAASPQNLLFSSTKKPQKKDEQQ